MRRLILLFIVLHVITFWATAQKKAPLKKYPSLFWEITGNGLQKPSYLFGTMHVSSKMVFHLSDSFYYAMRNTDAVALELNPESWQDEMFRLQKAQLNLARFSLGKMNDYLKESSFRLEKYEDNIKRAITEEPTVVNNLLYRSYQTTADFEENTYLDLYIYQTGRKLGKKPTGVENYLESERLMMEAYQDMVKDKSKRRYDGDGESFYDIQKRIQQAYRSGDLDLMDSLQALTNISSAFSEKFLYLRNEIQANSIDTILKKHSLFVGVGAAHLPGPRGVIELLRKKGFRLRPIFMQDRDASQKDEIDKLRVPVVFQPETTPDGMIQLQLPGKLYKREEARGNESWQYADMNNGSYYMLTRVRTHAALMGHSSKSVLSKLESMLYENIPGRILKKTAINKNGYPGFDIINRTRRGDLQRYQLLVTPFEVLVFKMSGNDMYVEGKESDLFFNSIKIKPLTGARRNDYQPKQGGFKVKLPAAVTETFNKNVADLADRWEYESADNNNGNAYMIWKKSLYNFNFIEEDTFDLAMAEESFKSSEIINKRLSRKTGIKNKVHYLQSSYLLNDGGGYMTLKAFIKGPHYYLLAVRTKDKKANTSSFFNSFQFTDFNYSTPRHYVDSALKLEVMTPVKPNVDTVLRSWMEKGGGDRLSAVEGNYSGWPKSNTGIFKSDSTGESILVSVQTFPAYYYERDSAAFWSDKLDEQKLTADMVLRKKQFFKLNDSVCGYHVILTDTNSSRCIKSDFLLAGNTLYKFSTVTDTLAKESKFVKTFFATAKPFIRHSASSVFTSKTDTFFSNFYSSDSLVSKQAKQAISSINFNIADIQKIVKAINSLRFNDKDYLDIKSRFINELGYLKDTSGKQNLVGILKELYEKSADTIYFQNAVLSSLARLQTTPAYNLLKELLVQDPPVFEDAYGHEVIFSPMRDTLKLAKKLFPEILQLAALEDYKPYINSLLKDLVDSNYLKAGDYESYFSKLYFDAKTELKKQQSKDEKLLGKDTDDDDMETDIEYRSIYKEANSSSASSFSEYATLLMPFYDKFNSVPKFFEKLLASKDVSVQLAAARAMILNHKKIPDSLFATVASQDRYRVKLLSLLNKINRKDLFPARYKTQEMAAKALLLNDKNYKEFAKIELTGKTIVQVKESKGYVYLFRYKINNGDDWKIGISGIQPLNLKEISTNNDLVKLTDKKIKANEPVAEQFEEQIRRLLFAGHKSGRRFYESRGSYFSNSDFED